MSIHSSIDRSKGCCWPDPALLALPHASALRRPARSWRSTGASSGALLDTVRSPGAVQDVAVAESEDYSLLFGSRHRRRSRAMGLPLRQSRLVGDGNSIPTRPEIVIYEPKGNGRVSLIGADYL